VKKFYYYWFFNKQNDDWWCTITPKEYFDTEGHLDDRRGILDNATTNRFGLCEVMESEFQMHPDTKLTLDEIKNLWKKIRTLLMI